MLAVRSLQWVMVAMVCLACRAWAADAPKAMDLEPRIESLLSQLTLEEKVRLLSGVSSFETASIERLGIHGMRFVDGPNGARSNDGDAATAFPVGLALAATWDPKLVHEVGAAIGREVRALRASVLLGPNLNLVRSPLSGRNFETYGEDPFLAGRIAVGFVQGVQSEHVGVSSKHYVGNEQETERSRSSSNIDARTLREIYLVPFEAAVREAHPWAIMAAYNRVNGIYMSEHAGLLREVLKQEWGFDGVAMSDWGGTHSSTAVESGLDLEMPGPPRQFGPRLAQAVNLFQVSQSALDDAARRMLRLYARAGALDAAAAAGEVVSTPEHRALARAAAASAITLLKNDEGALPIDLRGVRSVAIIGPNADVAIVQGGGSAQVNVSNIVSPLDAIRALAGDAVTVSYAQGVDNDRYAPVIDGRDLSAGPDRATRGLQVAYYPNAEFAGTPLKSRVELSLGALRLGNDVALQGNGNLSVRWRGYFWPRVSGEHEFVVEHLVLNADSTIGGPGAATEVHFNLGGRELIGPATPPGPGTAPFFPTVTRTAKVTLRAGESYPIEVAYAGRDLSFHMLKVAARLPAGTLDAAVNAARAADAAVVFVGSSTTTETEGRDRESLRLYGEQDALVQAVAEANPRTIVVLNNGGPVEMPWVERVPAIVEAWLPGQEGPLAVADVLFGRVNPSGKLPVSFPKRLQDNPSYLYYPGHRDADYGEGLFVGYRYYDKKDVAPLFPFGHGLSYTQFEYRNLRAPSIVRSGARVQVSVDVENAGSRSGTDTVQLYLADPHCQEVCPIRELKAFARVTLDSGQEQTVSLDLDARAFAHYDAHAQAWRTTPGEFVIEVGGSSRDLRLRHSLTVESHPSP